MDGRPDTGRCERLICLIYELLDAHEDTARIAAGAPDPMWQTHLVYLRDLQRLGREVLAAAGEAEVSRRVANAQVERISPSWRLARCEDREWPSPRPPR
jgi:hypothetical protein